MTNVSQLHSTKHKCKHWKHKASTYYCYFYSYLGLDQFPESLQQRVLRIASEDRLDSFEK